MIDLLSLTAVFLGGLVMIRLAQQRNKMSSVLYVTSYTLFVISWIVFTIGG